MNTPKPCDTCKYLYVDCMCEDDPNYEAECKLEHPLSPYCRDYTCWEERLEMKASEKHPVLEDMLTSLSGRDRKSSISNNICNWCGGPAAEFSDELSRKEYCISGMCQKCQDATFKEEE